MNSWNIFIHSITHTFIPAHSNSPNYLRVKIEINVNNLWDTHENAAHKRNYAQAKKTGWYATNSEQQPNSKEENLVIFYLLQSDLASDVRQIWSPVHNIIRTNMPNVVGVKWFMVFGVWAYQERISQFYSGKQGLRNRRQLNSHMTQQITKANNNMKQISSDGIAEDNREGKL